MFFIDGFVVIRICLIFINSYLFVILEHLRNIFIVHKLYTDNWLWYGIRWCNDIDFLREWKSLFRLVAGGLKQGRQQAARPLFHHLLSADSWQSVGVLVYTSLTILSSLPPFLVLFLPLAKVPFGGVQLRLLRLFAKKIMIPFMVGLAGRWANKVFEILQRVVSWARVLEVVLRNEAELFSGQKVRRWH